MKFEEACVFLILFLSHHRCISLKHFQNLISLSQREKECFQVFCIRLLSGYHPLRPDRNHIHHVLLDLGFGHKKATIILYIFSLFIMFLSYFMIDMSLSLSIFLLSIIVLGLMAIPFVILQIKKKRRA